MFEFMYIVVRRDTTWHGFSYKSVSRFSHNGALVGKSDPNTSSPPNTTVYFEDQAAADGKSASLPPSFIPSFPPLSFLLSFTFSPCSLS